jgi:hypothetical protein
VLLPLLLSALLTPLATAAPVAHDLGVWTAGFLQVDLHPETVVGARIWFDGHVRRTDTSFVGIVRPGLGVDLAQGVTVSGGVAWVPQVGDSTEGALRSEGRLWEQVLLQRPLGRVQASLRPRLEQRRLPDDSAWAHRVRLWGRLGIPLRPGVGLAFSDEVFVGLRETDATPAGFDQHRLFLGPWLALGDGARVEVGYLQAYLARDSGDSMVHTASTTFFAAF